VLVELGLVEQRYQDVLEMLNDGLTVAAHRRRRRGNPARRDTRKDAMSSARTATMRDQGEARLRPDNFQGHPPRSRSPQNEHEAIEGPRR